MKYRNLAIISIILLAVVGIAFSNFEFKEKRYHQHLEEKVRPEDVVTTDEFATHLPIIDIKTEAAIPPSHKERKDENGKIIKEKNYDVVKSSIKYIQNEDIENKRGDKPVFTTNAYIRTRGNSSREFEKKGYLLKFQNENYTDNRDIEIDGMVADSDWVLNGPYLDKTLIRNYMTYNVVGEIMDYSPNVRYCEVFINDEYMGLYLLIEKIGYNKNGRVDISKTDSKSRETSYIIKSDRPRESESVINTLNERIFMKTESTPEMEIIYPNKTLTEKQKDYIEKDIRTIEKVLMSSNFKDIKKGYRKYIDVDSFIDYCIINEFVSNIDANKYSMFLYKDVRGKLKRVVWDFNNAYNNYVNSNTTEVMTITTTWWYKYLMKDEYFNNKFIERYNYLRKNVLSDEYLNKYIDETIEYLGPAIERNYKRWPNVLKEDLLEDVELNNIPIKRNQHSYDEAILYLKNEIKSRGKFLDDTIGTIKYYSKNSIIGN